MQGVLFCFAESGHKTESVFNGTCKIYQFMILKFWHRNNQIHLIYYTCNSYLPFPQRFFGRICHEINPFGSGFFTNSEDSRFLSPEFLGMNSRRIPYHYCCSFRLQKTDHGFNNNRIGANTLGWVIVGENIWFYQDFFTFYIGTFSYFVYIENYIIDLLKIIFIALPDRNFIIHILY